MEKQESSNSFLQVIRSLSERSKEVLSRDVNRSSRESRRRKEWAKRGVVTTEETPSPSAPRNVEGVLGRGQRTSFSIGGREFRFDKKTVIIGELVLGVAVNAVVTRGSDGLDYAHKIMAVAKVSGL